MQDQTLLKISLTISFLGLVLLLFFSGESNYINEGNKGDIIIYGQIYDSKIYPKSTILKVKSECVKDVLIFESINFTKGDNITIYGNLDEEQIIANKIISSQVKSKFYK